MLWGITPENLPVAGRPKGSGRGGGRSGVARSNSGGSDDATLLHSTEHSRGDKTKRNPKQQLQNKQAQQRYRCGLPPGLLVSRSRVQIYSGVI